MVVAFLHLTSLLQNCSISEGKLTCGKILMKQLVVIRLAPHFLSFIVSLYPERRQTVFSAILC